MTEWSYTKVESNDARKVYLGRFSYVVRFDRLRNGDRLEDNITISDNVELSEIDVLVSAREALGQESAEKYGAAIDWESLVVVEALFNEYAQ